MTFRAIFPTETLHEFCEHVREESVPERARRAKKKKETLPPSPYRAPWAGVSKCSAVFMFLRTLDDLIYRWDDEVTLKTSRHRDVPAKETITQSSTKTICGVRNEA